MTASCRCRSFELRLTSTDFEPGRDAFTDAIHWKWRLRDDRLPEGETFLYVATDRCGWMPRIWHSRDDGLIWDESDAGDGQGLPLDDPEINHGLDDAIQDELRRVDLNRMLLIHNAPAPFRRPPATHSVARRAA